MSVEVDGTDLWTSTDTDGAFSLNGLECGTWTVRFSILGYRSYETEVSVGEGEIFVNIRLRKENFTLDEVLVTARSVKGINTVSEVDRQAIDHLQTSSLADVMNLMPGVLTRNPNLYSDNSITVRSLADGLMDRYSVGVSINGCPVSEDAGLSFGKMRSSYLSIPVFDFRSISTDNIESVKLLKGVLPARYGNALSGQMMVTTKAGSTPFELRLKTDPNGKSVSLGKGFAVGSDAGHVNIDMDYARAFSDRVSPVETYDRATLGIAYSNVFLKNSSPLSFNVRLGGYVSANSETSDPDVSSRDFYRMRDNSMSLSAYGRWTPGKKWITSVEYNVSGSFNVRRTRDYRFENILPLPSVSVDEEGLHEGFFTESSLPYDRRTEDIPVYFNMLLSASNDRKINGISLRTSAGFEYRLKGNAGSGEYYEGAAPQFFRPLSFSKMPFVGDAAVFLEEKADFSLWKGASMEIDAGVRISENLAEGYRGKVYADPRLNMRMELSSSSSAFEGSVALRAGWGIMRRPLSLVHLYPYPAYSDFVSCSFSGNDVAESLVLVQTFINDRKNSSIRPPESMNMEFGLDFELEGNSGYVSFFREKISGGIESLANYDIYEYRLYDNIADGSVPVCSGGTLYLCDNGVCTPAPYGTRREFALYDMFSNTAVMHKCGVEYSVSFRRIEPIRTSVTMNGAYIRQVSSSCGVSAYYPLRNDIADSRNPFPYVALFRNGTSIGCGTDRRRFNTNIGIVTNIPSMRMVVSMTLQCVWYESIRNVFPDGMVYYEDENGNAVFENFGNRDSGTLTLYRDPEYYVDADGIKHSFIDYHITDDPLLKKRLASLRVSSNRNYEFLERRYSPYFMANARVTKEIGNMVAISMYVNNFTDSRPVIRSSARPNAGGEIKNSEIFFGAEMKFSF